MIKLNSEQSFTSSNDPEIEYEVPPRQDGEMLLIHTLKQLEAKISSSGNKNREWAEDQVGTLSKDTNRLAAIKEELIKNSGKNQGNDNREEIIERLANELLAQPYNLEANAGNK